MLTALGEIVQQVGGLLLQWRDQQRFEGTWEGPQFKAEVDRLAHQALTERLQKLAPELPVVSEEDPDSYTGERPSDYWLIDPIDGTASFVNGFPGFVTQVARVTNNQPVLATIFAPALQLLFLAEQGRSTTLNGQPLQLAPKEVMETLIDNYPEPRGITAEAFQALGFRHYVECGGISLKICKIATGEADLFFKDVVVRDWDLAAPQLVLTEAGGALTDVTGRPIPYTGVMERQGLVAAANPRFLQTLVSWHGKRPLK
jgi:3'(2'), 5'-bisphosphate nucleotidase